MPRHKKSSCPIALMSGFGCRVSGYFEILYAGYNDYNSFNTTCDYSFSGRGESGL